MTSGWNCSEVQSTSLLLGVFLGDNPHPQTLENFTLCSAPSLAPYSQLQASWPHLQEESSRKQCNLPLLKITPQPLLQFPALISFSLLVHPQ